MTGENHSPRTS